MADVHLQVKPGGDALLLGAILGHIVQQGWHDEAFLTERCTDYEAVLDVLRGADVAGWARGAGVPVAEVHRVAQIIAHADSAAIRADLGLQQSPNSTLNSYLEKLLFLLTGNFGKPGGNVFHSNLLPLVGHSPEPDDGAALTSVTSMHPIGKLYPPNILPAEISSDHPGRIRAVVVDSANPLVSAADTTAYDNAFGALELLVVIDVAMTETAQLAHYVLPASSQFEKAEATFFTLRFPENGFHLRRPLMAPEGNTLPEPEIYRRLCVALGAMPDRFPVLERIARMDRRAKSWRTFEMALKARMAIAPHLMDVAPLVLYATLGKALPEGLQSAAVLWVACQRLAHKHPDAVRRAGTEDQGAGLGEALFDRILQGEHGIVMTTHEYEDTWSFIRHPHGRIHVGIPSLVEALGTLTPNETGPGGFPFTLMAGERRAYNANTILRDPAWRRKDAAGALRIHPEDAASLGLQPTDRVKVTSSTGSVTVEVAFTDELQRGVVSLPHGYGMEYPDADGRVAHGVRLNRLTSSTSCDPFTKTPLHKSVPVALTRVAPSQPVPLPVNSGGVKGLSTR